jgi:hypothetical protein
VAKKKVKPLFWITGNYYDCKRQWAWILGMLKGPNVEIFDCGAQSNDSRVAHASDIITCLKNRDIFDSRPRIIKMKGLPDDYTLLCDYLTLVNNDNVLVIDGPIGYRNANRRFVSAKTSKFYKEFSKQGVHKSPEGGTGVFDFPEVAESDSKAQSWITSVAKEHDREFEDGAALLLVQQKGRNLDQLYSELTCLMDYQIDKKIRVDDVRAVCVPVFVKTAWDLIDAIDRQEYEAAISHMQGFYANAGTKTGETFDGDVYKLLGALLQHFSFLMYLKMYCGDELTYSKAEQAVAGVKKQGENPNVWTDQFSKGYLYVNVRKPELQQALRRLSKERLEDIYLDLTRTRFLCRTKYSGSRAGMKICLDTFIMTACGVISSNYSAAVKGYKRWQARV